MEPQQLEEPKSDLNLRVERLKAGQAILLEEYKALWSYYIRTLDERGRIFDMYFRIIGFPFVLTGAIVLYLRSIDLSAMNPSASASFSQFTALLTNGLSIFFVLSFFSGVLAYIYYSLESANSRIYLRALTAIRNEWREQHKLRDALVIDLLRPKSKYLGDFIVHSRGAVFAMFNSSMLFVAVWFFFENSGLSTLFSRPALSSLALGAGVLGHVIIGLLAMKLYARSGPSRLIDEMIDKRIKSQLTEKSSP